MLQPRKSRKAGESAARKYEELTQAWLRRNRGRFLIMAAVLAPIVIGVNLAAARWSRLRWSAGLVTGVVIAMFLIARMSPPPWIENWQDGAFGEQWTGRALRELESQGWRIFHDLICSAVLSRGHGEAAPGWLRGRRFWWPDQVDELACVSVLDGAVRLIFAGWLPQDGLFGWDASAGLKVERGAGGCESPVCCS